MARTKPPSFDFFPDDFIAGTVGMHPLARGIYITLLCHQWSNGSVPGPDNVRQLVQVTGAMPDELSEHLPEVLSKFEEVDGVLINRRLASEYEKKEQARATKYANGKKGGRPRKNPAEETEQKPTGLDLETDSKPTGFESGPEQKPTGSVSHNLNETEKKPTVEAGSRKKEVGSRNQEEGSSEKKNGSLFKSFDSDSAFDRFWEVYPAKNAKAEAKKAFLKALERVAKASDVETGSEQLIRAASDYAAFLAGQESPPKAKYAQGWLNSERYHDDYRTLLAEAKRSGSKIGPGQNFSGRDGQSLTDRGF